MKRINEWLYVMGALFLSIFITVALFYLATVLSFGLIDGLLYAVGLR